MEFAETRPYQPSDDVRLIDWRQTARRGKPFTKRFQEERELPVWLLIDQGSSMRFGSHVAFKSAFAARAAALLAWQAVAGGDRVGGCVLTDEGYSLVQTRRGNKSVLALLQTLVNANTASPPLTPSQPTSGLAGGLQGLRKLTRPGSRVAILSDFTGFDESPGPLINEIEMLSRHHSVSLIQVIDRLELEAPPPGKYALTNGLGRWQIDLSDPNQRAAWGAPCRARSNALATLARSLADAQHLKLFVDAPLENVLAAWRRSPLWTPA